MAIGTEYTVTAEKKRYRLEINNLERFCFNGGVEEEVRLAERRDPHGDINLYDLLYTLIG